MPPLTFKVLKILYHANNCVLVNEIIAQLGDQIGKVIAALDWLNEKNYAKSPRNSFWEITDDGREFYELEAPEMGPKNGEDEKSP